MQTTLLGLGIAIILALLAALVGPFFIDWNEHRAFFESRASELAGMPVRIAGPIEARLLPSPSLSLRGVEAHAPDGAGPSIGAGQVSLEFALGALMRGDWRATEIRVRHPELTLSFDKNGRLAWPGGPPSVAETLSIDRLEITDGRLVIADAASGAALTLDRVAFAGDVRSFSGPLKGEGSFGFRDREHAFRLSLGAAGADDGHRLRVAIGGPGEPLVGDADGTLRFENGSPRFEGSANLTRGAALAMAGGRAVAETPWRVTSRVRASPERALFEQLELQLGPEDRGLKLGGTAELKGGERPRIEAVLSARQIDLDRFLGLPEETRSLPLVAVRALAETLEGAPVGGLPVRLGVGVDHVILGGGALQGLRGDLAMAPEGWTVETLEFRAPGSTDVRASGRVSGAGETLSFSGPASIAAGNPRALAAWLEGRPGGGGEPIGSLRASGTLTLKADAVAVDELDAEIDRKTFAGRLAYGRDAAGGHARLTADIRAAELDLDAVTALVRKAFPGASLALPGELALSLDLGLATAAGVEARGLKAALALDPTSLRVDRLTIGDLAGARLDVKGRIDALWESPRGALTLEAEGEKLDAVLALLGRVAPSAAEALARAAPQLAPAALRGVLDLRPTDAGKSTATVQLTGSAGALRIDFGGEATGTVADPQAAALQARGRVDAADGAVLARVLELERVFAPGNGPGSLQWTASGPLDGDLRIEAQLKTAGIEATAKGTLRAPRDQSWATRADLTITGADAPALRRLAGRPDEPAAVALKGRLAASAGYIALEDIDGRLAGALTRGRLGITPGAPARLDGRLDFDALSTSALVAAVMGTSENRPGGGDTLWASGAFSPPLLADLSGQLQVRARHASVPGDTFVDDLEAVLRPGDREEALRLRGRLSGGRLDASLGVLAGAFGRTASVKLALENVTAGKALPGKGAAPITGRFSLRAQATGSGASPAALVGSLSGTGTLTFEEAELAGLNPEVFAAIARAVDGGVEIEAGKIGPIAERELGGGRLRIRKADAALTIAAGQVRASSIVAKGEGADLAGSGSVDLSRALLDARLSLLGPPDPEVAAGRPEIAIAVKGPLAGPQRSVDVSPLLAWMTLRSVELQARRLEALEADRRGGDGTPTTSVPGAPARPRPAVPARPRAVVPPAAPRVAPAPPIAVPRRPALPPVSERVPALSDPLDIRPAPAPRRSSERPAQPRGSAEHDDWWSPPGPRPWERQQGGGADLLFGSGGR